VLGFRRQKEKVVWAEREKGIGNAIEIQIKKKEIQTKGGLKSNRASGVLSKIEQLKFGSRI
jgi:hypothetical protein